VSCANTARRSAAAPKPSANIAPGQRRGRPRRLRALSDRGPSAAPSKRSRSPEPAATPSGSLARDRAASSRREMVVHHRRRPAHRHQQKVRNVAASHAVDRRGQPKRLRVDRRDIHIEIRQHQPSQLQLARRPHARPSWPPNTHPRGAAGPAGTGTAATATNQRSAPPKRGQRNCPNLRVGPELNQRPGSSPPASSVCPAGYGTWPT
jgi:hypothetical protein